MNTNFSAINKAMWKQQHSFMYMLSMTAFTLQWQGWVVATERAWAPKSKLITKYPVQEKLVYLLSWI